MSRIEYYEDLKALARGVRAEFGLLTPRVLRTDLRRIYKDKGIQFDLWPPKNSPPGTKLKRLRGAFFYDEYGATIMISRGLPNDPAVFTMAHELKHFLVDQHLKTVFCGENNIGEEIEIGAEIFAAELIFPDADFQHNMQLKGIVKGSCTAEVLVHLKHDTQTTLSYAGLVKKAEFLGFASPGSLSGVKWKKLEEQIYGVPFYKK